MDFLRVSQRRKNGVVEVYPEFIITDSRDLLVKGGKFYAIWDPENKIWSKDIYRVVDLVDHELFEYASMVEKTSDFPVKVLDLSSFSTGSWTKFMDYINRRQNSVVNLDSRVVFQGEELSREDYCSKRVPYSLVEGDCSAWDELVGTLYSPVEREKIEWAIGAIVAGESVNIQKFIVFFGDPGSGKSTVLNIIQMLFEGYTSIFEAKELTSASNAFAAEAFKDNPLIGIQHDGDLSRIEDNSKLNSIVSHETILMNEKFKSAYSMRINTFLFMATNKPVKITDAKSGVLRRLIDVIPTGNTIVFNRYRRLMDQIPFQLGAIAKHCCDTFKKLGPNFYDSYRPFSMMYQTDPFFNFVEDCYLVFKEQDGTSLKQAWTLYKKYCEETSLNYTMPMYRFRDELKSYFRKFYGITRVGDVQVRSYFKGFKYEKFDMSREESTKSDEEEMKPETWLVLDQTESIFDKVCGNCPAQYATSNDTPMKKWEDVDTKLRDISTDKVHYVLLPENHIVIDFDLKNEKGEKDLERNLTAANKWPKTYAEVSKGGSGLHLHYIYDGDSAKLSRVYEDGIEVKVFTGYSSLRRRLSKCNGLEISHISSGLPFKEETKKMLDQEVVLNEKKIRELIERNLRKEIHPGTKPSIDFIYTILEEQYNRGAKYDVTDMRQAVMLFASKSSHHARYCLNKVSQMKFKSDEESEKVEEKEEVAESGDISDKKVDDDSDIVFFDIEVFPNLFLVNWKQRGPDHQIVRMINPSPVEIEDLCKQKLVGFNNRRYDNHILYARIMGYSNEQLFKLSQKLITAKKSADVFFPEAYNLSYTDIYDFASAGNKKSLKKWEIELGIHHQELGLPWDQPVPEEKWVEVAEYCDNDVIATEAVFDHLQADWRCRKMLANLSGLSVNHTTNQHSIAFVFGTDKFPGLIYTDLATGEQYGPGEPGPYDPITHERRDAADK